MSDKPVLEVKDLRVYFPVKSGFWGRVTGHVHAVDGVSFTLQSGKTLGLVGESGCGKSTLGRAIIQLIKANSGDVFFLGQNLQKLSNKELKMVRKNLQIIFQDPYSSLNPRMSVQQILSEPFDIHGVYENSSEKKQAIEELLVEVGLSSSSLLRYPHEFSGGQRQRIGIARALALKPQLIICDEPVSALDVSIQSQILNLLMDLRDKYHLSYLFIAHDLAVIEHISDEVAVMYLGQIVEHASSVDLYSRPMHPYTQILMDSIPTTQFIKKREKTLIQGDVPSPISPPSGCRFHTRCPKVQQICKMVSPVLQNLGTESTPHLVACHFPDTKSLTT